MRPSTVDVLTRAGLDPDHVEDVINRALAEDRPGVDVTSGATIPPDQVDTADIVARADGVLAGIPIVAAVFDDLDIHLSTKDGERIHRGDILATITGTTIALLTAERTALNLLCHLSGIATLTARWVAAVAGTGARIRDTRKTTPGLRHLEKYAVRCGGGTNHRLSLSDQALIKDNHILAAGGVVEAYTAVRARYPDLPIEVECATLDQVRAVIAAGADLILLDNMPIETMAEAVQIARPHQVRLEASGNLRLDNARAVAETGVDYLSIGALTHSAPVLDIALDLRSRA